MFRVRSTILLLTLAATALALVPVGPAAAQGDPPNILILLVDDLGLEHVGFYDVGSEPAPMPRLEQLAAEGLVFEHAWATPVCSPTRTAIQTGRYPFRSGVGSAVTDDTVQGLPLSEVTLPEVLAAAPTPYATGAFGKWHLGMDSSLGGTEAPNLHGYDHFEGTRANLAEESYFEYTKITNGSAALVEGYAASITVDDTLAWIDGQTGPWLAYIGFHAPHYPIHWPPEELHTQDTGQTDDLSKFRAMVEALDTEIGRLLDSFDTSNTLVFFASDNGSPRAVVLDPFRAGRTKHTVFEGGVRVPFTAWGAGVPQGTVTATVNLADIFATAVEVAGATLPDVEIDSVSLVPYFSDPGLSLRDLNYTETFSPNGLSGPYDKYQKTGRDGRYKLLRNEAGNEAMIDLELDPYETSNLLSEPLSPEEQAAYDTLAAFLESLGNDGEDTCKAFGDSCSGNDECCSGNCGGPPDRKTCK